MDGYVIAGAGRRLKKANPAAVPSKPGEAPKPTGAISLVDALKGQLGLKVETRKVMAPVLIVDHVNATPTGN